MSFRAVSEHFRVKFASGQFRQVCIGLIATLLVLLLADVTPTCASCGDWLQRHSQQSPPEERAPADDGADRVPPAPCSNSECQNNSTPPLQPLPTNAPSPRVGECGLPKVDSVDSHSDSWHSLPLCSVVPASGHGPRIDRPPRISTYPSA